MLASIIHLSVTFGRSLGEFRALYEPICSKSNQLLSLTELQELCGSRALVKPFPHRLLCVLVIDADTSKYGMVQREVRFEGGWVDARGFPLSAFAPRKATLS